MASKAKDRFDGMDDFPISGPRIIRLKQISGNHKMIKIVRTIYCYILTLVFAVVTYQAFSSSQLEGAARAQAEFVIFLYIPFQVISLPAAFCLFIDLIERRAELLKAKMELFQKLLIVGLPWLGTVVALAIIL